MPLVAHIPRDQFLAEHWTYRPGEHVSMIEPTQQGKTYLAYQLLQKTMAAHPELRTVTLMPKPRDPATQEWITRLEMQETQDWPPPRKWWRAKPPGYALWPPHLRGVDPMRNREHLGVIFRRCLADQYWTGDSITMADDVYLLAVRMGLNPDMEEFWTAGAGGGAGLWTMNQKPSGTMGGGSVSSFSYNAPTHLFLGKDPDERNQKRFSEIGGVDPKMVTEIVRGLKMHQVNGKNVSEKLYIHKGGPYMCTVGI